jgi:hypothetical protein
VRSCTHFSSSGHSSRRIVVQYVACVGAPLLSLLSVCSTPVTTWLKRVRFLKQLTADVALFSRSKKSNEFSGKVNWVQIDLEKDDHNHLISPEERLTIAMARQ